MSSFLPLFLSPKDSKGKAVALRIRAYLYRWYVLCRLEWRLLLRQHTAWSSALLFVLAAVFAVYASTWGSAQALDTRLWIGLFWIIMLFASLYVMSNGLGQGQLLFYYLLENSTLLFATKVLGQTLVLFVLGLVVWAAMALGLGHPIEYIGLFIWSLGGGVLGIATVGVCTAWMVEKIGGRPILLVVLALPLLLPIFLFALHSTYAACVGGDITFIWGLWSLVTCAGLFIFVVLPFIWKS